MSYFQPRDWEGMTFSEKVASLKRSPRPAQNQDKVPFGYKYFYDFGGTKRLVLDSRTVRVTSLLFEGICQGHLNSMPEVASFLNDHLGKAFSVIEARNLLMEPRMASYFRLPDYFEQTLSGGRPKPKNEARLYEKAVTRMVEGIW